jgi:hypothetical protein
LAYVAFGYRQSNWLCWPNNCVFFEKAAAGYLFHCLNGEQIGGKPPVTYWAVISWQAQQQTKAVLAG